MSGTQRTPSGHYPPNPYAGGTLQSHETARPPLEASVALETWTAAEAATSAAAGVHAAVADTGSQQTISSGFTALPAPRNVTATITGTAGDVKAISGGTITGKRAGVTITEVLPAFTVDTLGTVAGSKIFDEITGWVFGPHDGTGVSVSLGFGEKLGLSSKLTRDTVQEAFLGTTPAREGTRPTVGVDPANLENNYVDLNSALNGTPVAVYYLVP